jgi:ADP-dependent NAD(P)H-hydrate dehydratase / NAD(P)H-hydrate epimerase
MLTAIVTTQQIRDVEHLTFAWGMPVAALMEKVGCLLFERITHYYPRATHPRVGLLVGPGHNGADALVVGRELLLEGREVWAWLSKPGKELTQAHQSYFEYLGGHVVTDISALADCTLLIDGIFGFGLERASEGVYAEAIAWANHQSALIVSVDVPSGLHTDTGQALGVTIKAQRTFCLGLWKRGLLQDHALEYTGISELIDIGFSQGCVEQVLGQTPLVQTLDTSAMYRKLPLQRLLATHKYQVGKAWILAGSPEYPGAGILAGLGCRGSGVGLVTMAVAEPLRSLVMDHLPDAVLVSPMEDQGDFSHFQALLCGPGMLSNPTLIQKILQTSRVPLVLDAGALSSLVGHLSWVQEAAVPVVLTPHVGEFKRLFPDIAREDRLDAAQKAAQQSGAVVVLKGARTVIAHPDGSVRVNIESTPALARGGSGDVLAGLISGLLAQGLDPFEAACVGVWWHSQTGIYLAQQRSVLGVDPYHLALALPETLVGLEVEGKGI